jgi:uncharacterized damage-inducible protein DinB
MIAATVEANRCVVRQEIALLRTLDAAAFNRRAAEVFASTIGGHVRHIIEHYRAFLDGLRQRAIDYEKRARDPRIEQEPAHALAALQRIDGELGALDAALHADAFAVTAEYGDDADAPPRAASSALRELEFLLSHTVHHHALIAVICHLHGHATPADFGVAPSTLRHQQRTRSPAAACAH